jgi:antitoxin VapB
MSTTALTVAEKAAEYLPPVAAPAPASADASRRVSLFRNGANQAVRIPKEFELPGKEAILRREGNLLVLEAVPDKPKKGTAAALVAALEEMAKLGPIDEEFPDVDEGLLPLDDVDFGED